MTQATDIPQELTFVDPTQTEKTWRVCLWAAPGQGKSVAAASAPTPNLVINGDRPSAYMFARKHHGLTQHDLREVRYRGEQTLNLVYRYIRDNAATPDAVRTITIDPVGSVYDDLVDNGPTRMVKGEPEPQWTVINKKLLGFVQSLRAFDVNVVLVAHERLSDGDKGDGRLYPALGGPSLINKLLAEMDICAHVERIARPTEQEPDGAVWVGQIQPRGNLVCKDGTGALGDRRIADLSRWFELASAALSPDDTDLPWNPHPDPDPDPEVEGEPPADVGLPFDEAV